jgi:hypothetical protein
MWGHQKPVCPTPGRDNKYRADRSRTTGSVSTLFCSFFNQYAVKLLQMADNY